MTDRIAQIRARLEKATSDGGYDYDSSCFSDDLFYVDERIMFAAAPADLAWCLEEIERLTKERREAFAEAADAWKDRSAEARRIDTVNQNIFAEQRERTEEMMKQRDHYRTACETMREQIEAKDADIERLRALAIRALRHDLASSGDRRDWDEGERIEAEIEKLSRVDGVK